MQNQATNTLQVEEELREGMEQLSQNSFRAATLEKALDQAKVSPLSLAHVFIIWPRL